MEGTRTPGLLIRSQSLYPAELPTHTFRSEHDVFYHAEGVLSTCFLNYFYIFEKECLFVVSVLIFTVSSILCKQAAAVRARFFGQGPGTKRLSVLIPGSAGHRQKRSQNPQTGIFYDFSCIAFSVLVL